VNRAPLQRISEVTQRFPRVSLTHTPTPLEFLPNLSRHLGVNVHVKRDDCTGLAMGGNKARQLEFHFGEARRRCADTILITGAVQSNYVRMAAAGARKCGMDCHVQLEQRVPHMDECYNRSGNVLLDRLFGATVYDYPDGEDEHGADSNLERIAESLRAEGRRPYIIYLGPDRPPIGALGYVLAARELINQRDNLGIRVNRIVVASGSSHTHTGLLMGLRIAEDLTPVTGICVRRNADLQRDRVRNCASDLEGMLALAETVTAGDIDVRDEVLAPGYGRVSEVVMAAMRMAAKLEGLLLDPVYSGKAMAGLFAGVSDGYIQPSESVLFLHTGGLPAIFAYQSAVEEALHGQPENAGIGASRLT